MTIEASGKNRWFNLDFVNVLCGDAALLDFFSKRMEETPPIHSVGPPEEVLAVFGGITERLEASVVPCGNWGIGH